MSTWHIEIRLRINISTTHIEMSTTVYVCVDTVIRAESMTDSYFTLFYRDFIICRSRYIVDILRLKNCARGQKTTFSMSGGEHLQQYALWLQHIRKKFL